MTLVEVIRTRGIEEIIHFTTNKGVLGILDAEALKSRSRLQVDQRLEYIFQPNAADRTKDAAWLDYVNLSVSQINTQFFNASGKWHLGQNLWWCALVFVPDILTHSDVVFTTTNNIYTGVHRMSGGEGLQNMFASTVTRWNGNSVLRSGVLPDNCTTCIQAEVLYPKQVSTEFLKKIYVTNDQSADELAGQLRMLGHAEVPIEINPTLFTTNR